MDRRTVATPNALRAAQTMQALLHGSLTQDAQRIVRALDTLANPQLWDGRSAQVFRQSEGPHAKAALLGAIRSLQTLDAHVTRVVQDIMRAGAEGTSANPGTAGGGGNYWELIPGWNSLVNGPLGDVLRIRNLLRARWNAVAATRLLKEWSAYQQDLRALANDTSLSPAARAARLSAIEAFAGEAVNARMTSIANFVKLRYEISSVSTVVSKIPGLLRLSFLGDLPTGKIIAPLAVISDIGTIGTAFTRPGAQSTVSAVAAGLNITGIGMAAAGTGMGGTVAALVGINAVADWVPVAGQLLAAGSALYLTGAWAYQHWQPFHSAVNAVGHFFASIF